MRAVPGIVALHASAFAGDHARRQAVAARSIATGEAVAGGEGETGTAMARGAAFAVGDARDAARCILGRQRGGAQCFGVGFAAVVEVEVRSEEHTSELQSLMRISYAVFCLKKKKVNTKVHKRIL